MACTGTTGDCSTSCAGGCTGGATNGNCNGCSGGCAGGCYFGCAHECTGVCENNCTGTCTGKCTGGCSDTCTGGCTGCSGCGGSCSRNCSGTCSARCTGSCKGACNAGCTSSEQTTALNNISAMQDIVNSTDANNLRSFIYAEIVTRRGLAWSTNPELTGKTIAAAAWWDQLRTNLKKATTVNDTSTSKNIMTKTARNEMVNKAKELYNATIGKA